jgi:hypothetical protein
VKIGLFVDQGRLTRWQAAALQTLPADTEFVVYDCLNTRGGRRRARHAFYYLLNLFTIRNRSTRTVPLSETRAAAAPVTAFETGYEGSWQTLPAPLIARIVADGPNVLLKFGLSLLRIPPETVLAVPILSYHHGDPAAYRGRPAGFWELLHGKQIMGQIVQILSNRLDAGTVVAFGESKVFSHSYRATLIEAYNRSPLLLTVAIANAVRRSTIEHPTHGRIYRLPGTMDVLRLLGRTTAARVRRLLYGAFIEKKWEVSTAPAEAAAIVEGDEPLPARAAWTTLPRPKGYTFLADPFFAPAGSGLVVEALRGRSGCGEILHVYAGKAARVSPGSGHYSYPASVAEGGRTFFVPEVALWSPPVIYQGSDASWRPVAPLDVAGAPRLLDPTFLRHDGRLYLFASLLDEGGGVLRLWHGESLFGRFEEHPASPVRVSPDGSRMAGGIVQLARTSYRLGQQWQEEYGDGLIVFRIEEVSATAYRETPVCRIRFDDLKGPHTLNFRDGLAVFDWYRDRFSAFAGFRRAAALWKAS